MDISVPNVRRGGSRSLSVSRPHPRSIIPVVLLGSTYYVYTYRNQTRKNFKTFLYNYLLCNGKKFSNCNNKHFLKHAKKIKIIIFLVL